MPSRAWCVLISSLFAMQVFGTRTLFGRVLHAFVTSHIYLLRTRQHIYIIYLHCIARTRILYSIPVYHISLLMQFHSQLLHADALGSCRQLKADCIETMRNQQTRTKLITRKSTGDKIELMRQPSVQQIETRSRVSSVSICMRGNGGFECWGSEGWRGGSLTRV